MTAVVAHPLAALRVLRRAGRRRALRVAFFLGGLLALGSLWGGQAYAAEAPLPPRDANAVVNPVDAVSAVNAVDRVTPVAPAAAQALPEVAEPPADVVPSVTRPVGELKDRVVQQQPAATPELPTPGLPVPALPAHEVPAHEVPVPEVPVPGAPGVPGAPEVPLPVPAVPVVQGPSADGGTESPVESEQSVRQGSGERVLPDGSRFLTAIAGVAEQGAYPYGLAGAQRDDAHRGPGRPECGEAPVPAPSGPCGDGVRQSAGDVNPSRSGDKHAAAFADGARFGLVRGATLPTTAAPTYDRPHEVLEFPG
ncbi:hypothetical protein AB0P36_06455 [Streptomyces flavidovirens]|uniref:hypothetical protein n=1 Tax=Streptomyces flavidovirens TaxID=67298 RepID=UPI003435849C